MTDPASGCDHHIYVRYPDGYDAALATRYPVVVVLDGDGLFPLLAPTPLFLHDDEPALICAWRWPVVRATRSSDSALRATGPRTGRRLCPTHHGG